MIGTVRASLHQPKKETAAAGSESRCAAAYSFNSRLAVTRLQITLRAHVVVDLAQVKLQLFAIEDVLSLEAA